MELNATYQLPVYVHERKYKYLNPKGRALLGTSKELGLEATDEKTNCIIIYVQQSVG